MPIDATITASRAGEGVRGGVAIHTCDRTVLRKILLTGLDDYISYRKQLVEHSIADDGVTATFKDGTLHKGRLLVGADGTPSPVRKQYLPTHQPVDTNGSCIYDKTPLTLLLEPIRFPKNAHRDSLPVDYIYWVLISRTDVFIAHTKDFLHLNSEESAALSLKLTDEWDPSIRALLELQDVAQSSTLRVRSAIPNPQPWNASERVTLLGDAIHAMSPCGGVGAVTALRDAALLMEKLVEGGVSAESVAK